MSALGVIAAPSIVGASESELMKLGVSFDLAERQQKAAWAALELPLPEKEGEVARAAAEAASDAVFDIADQIAKMPARTIEELRLKGRVVRWGWLDNLQLEDGEEHDSADVRYLQSLVRDLVVLS